MNTALLAALFFAVAVLYSTVGHAGATGYLAAMAFLAVAPEVMRPTALVLNIIVAVIGTVKFARAGWFSWRLFWPFAVASVPAAYIGGRLGLPAHLYKVVVGIVLLFAAIRLFYTARRADDFETRPIPIWAALLTGAVLGLLAGLTGVGGGVFLSPLLLVMRWAKVKPTSGVAAPFILVNSLAGLAGALPSLSHLDANLIVWVPCVVVGGWLGAEYGSKRFGSPVLRRWLAATLVVAAVKLVTG